MKNFPKTVKWAERVKILPRIRWSSAVRLKWAIDPFLLIPGSKRFSTNPMTGSLTKNRTNRINAPSFHCQYWLIDQTYPGVTSCIFPLTRQIRGLHPTVTVNIDWPDKSGGYTLHISLDEMNTGVASHITQTLFWQLKKLPSRLRLASDATARRKSSITASGPRTPSKVCLSSTSI